MGVALSKVWRIACLTAAAGALGMLVPATAGAELRWQPVQEIADGPSVLAVQIAVDARGDALAMWLVPRGFLKNEVQYAWRTAHGAWGPPRSLPFQLLQGAATFAVSPRGNATAAYQLADGRVGIASGLPGQALSLTQALGSPDRTGVSFSDLVVDDEGGATVGWSASNGDLVVATRRAGGTFGALERLGRNSLGSPPVVAVNPAGAAVVAWLAFANTSDPSSGPRAAYRLPGAAAFGPPEPLNVPFSPFGTFAAIDAQGTAVVAASGGFLGTPLGTGLSVRPPLGSFGAPQKIEDAAILSAVEPEPGGALSLISERFAPGGQSGPITVTERPATGALGAPVVISDPGSCSSDASSSPRGDLLVTYVLPCSGAPDASTARISLRRSTAVGFDAPLSLSAGGRPDSALTGTGEGIVAFDRNAFSASSIAFEDLDRPVPPLPTEVQIDARSVVLSRDGKLGLPIRCQIRCRVRPTGILITTSKLTASKRTASRRLRAKTRTRVRVRFSRARVLEARRALRRGQRVTLSYTVTTIGRSARALAQSRMVRLRLKR